MATRMKITKAAKMMSKITKVNNRPTRMQTINPARQSKNNRSINKMGGVHRNPICRVKKINLRKSTIRKVRRRSNSQQICNPNRK